MRSSRPLLPSSPCRSKSPAAAVDQSGRGRARRKLWVAPCLLRSSASPRTNMGVGRPLRKSRSANCLARLLGCHRRNDRNAVRDDLDFDEWYFGASPWGWSHATPRRSNTGLHVGSSHARITFAACFASGRRRTCVPSFRASLSISLVEWWTSTPLPAIEGVERGLVPISPVLLYRSTLRNSSPLPGRSTFTTLAPISAASWCTTDPK